MDTHFTRNWNLPAALGFLGILLGVSPAACSATAPAATGQFAGSAATAAETAGTGGSASASAGADNSTAGAIAGEASHAAGAPDVESAGSAGSAIAVGGGGAPAGGAGPGSSGADPSGGRGGESSAGSTGNGNELMVPCEVYAAYRVCRNCHVDPPRNGAPMPLLTLLDLQTSAAAEYQAVASGVMPAVGTLSATEAALLLDWLSAGAQGVPQSSCPSTSSELTR